jgi:NhaP-type Na+/H+ or K+/H+ antiporter
MGIDAALAIVGATLLVLGLGAGLIKNRWYVSEPLVALLMGFGLGPLLTDWTSIDPALQLRFLEEAARFTLTIALVDVAMSLPRDYLARAWKPLAVMLGLAMPLMWVASAALAAVVLGMPVALALTVGAVITPTDPVLAGSIVSGKLAEQNLPDPLRRLIAAESGANDALALPLVAFGISLLGNGAGTSWPSWVAHVLLLEVAGGICIGAVAGWLTARVARWAARQPDAEQASLTSIALALAITLLGAVRLLHSDGILAAFVAGLVLSRFLTGELAMQRSIFHETIRRFFELPIFFLVGALLPLAGLAELGWRHLVFAVAILLLRRIPVVWGLRPLIAPIRSATDTWFAGWFGPVGIAAVYYAAMATRQTGDTRIWAIATLIVTASVLAHGITGTELTKRYGHRVTR